MMLKGRDIGQCTRKCFFLLVYFVLADSLSKLREKGTNRSYIGFAKVKVNEFRGNRFPTVAIK